MDYVIYRSDNGEIVRSFTGNSDHLALQLGADEAAIEGVGAWMTHRVERGELVRLDSVRTCPQPGWHWDAAAATWFDPLLRPETADAARVAMRGRVMSRILVLEAAQARPLRELGVARALGLDVPAGAREALLAIESEVISLRAQLASLM